jgi:photosystem II stability/assembly factor-like uncharacterized protein
MKAARVVRSAGTALICVAAIAAAPASATAGTKTLGYGATSFDGKLRAESSIATATRTSRGANGWTVSGRATIRDRASDGYCARVQLVFLDARGRRLESVERTDCAGVWRTHRYSLSFESRPVRMDRYVGTKQMWSVRGVASLI